MAPTNQNRQAVGLVLTALKNLRGGVTLSCINKYVRDKFPVKCTPGKLRRAVDKAVEFGAVNRQRNKYSLGHVLGYINQARRRRKSSGIKKKRRRRRRH